MPKPTSGEISMETKALDRLRFSVMEYLSPALINTVDMETWRDEMLDRMAYRLSVEVLAEKLAEEKIEVRFKKDVHFSYPKNWWNHLKDQWNGWWVVHRPRWFSIRVGLWLVRPVKLQTVVKTVGETRRVKVEQFATFPEHNIVTPSDLRGPTVVRYERVI